MPTPIPVHCTALTIPNWRRIRFEIAFVSSLIGGAGLRRRTTEAQINATGAMARAR